MREQICLYSKSLVVTQAYLVICASIQTLEVQTTVWLLYGECHSHYKINISLYFCVL